MVNIVSTSNDIGGIRTSTRGLLKRQLGKLTGLEKRLGFLLRSHNEPRIMIAGVDLTGVHYLRGLMPPVEGSYHIGGSGLMLEEALIRSLGETIERYSQLVAEVSNKHAIRFCSYDELSVEADEIISERSLCFFTDQQHNRPGFPFARFDRHRVMGWVKVKSIYDDNLCWIPAQLLMVGYVPKGELGEDWILSSVTTGTAAHTNKYKALSNAIFELIQIDSAMGHWYSSQIAPEIILTERTRALQNLIDKTFTSNFSKPKFYYLKNPDLPGITIACAIKQPPPIVPSFGVGLGISFDLEEAMYKALLEGIGVLQLAKVELMNHEVGNESLSTRVVDPDQIFNLDSNVVYYASQENRHILDIKFSEKESILDTELPENVKVGEKEEVKLLINAFRITGKRLYFLDLTTRDIEELGFCSLRVWSPDTISLSLPSAAPFNHQRFSAYGGAGNEKPHPYP